MEDNNPDRPSSEDHEEAELHLRAPSFSVAPPPSSLSRTPSPGSNVFPVPSLLRLVSTPSYAARERRDQCQDNVVDWKGLKDSTRTSRSGTSASPHWCCSVLPLCHLLSHLHAFLADELSAIVLLSRLFLKDPWSFVIVGFLSMASPCFFYYNYFKSEIDDSHEGRRLSFNLSWTLLSTAVVFPLTMTLSEVFKRRESALNQIASFKANVTSYYMAHEDWGWYSAPTPSNPHGVSTRPESAKRAHLTAVRSELMFFIDSFLSMLSAPRCSSARHFYTVRGMIERKVVMERLDQLNSRITDHIHNMSLFTEKMKAEGLPAGEATRIRAFESSILMSVEQLRALKEYRTPLGLRSFARLFILIIPIMFGPYYVTVALATNLPFAIATSVVTSWSVQALYNLRHQLEDPFNYHHSPDAVNVEDECMELKIALSCISSHSKEPTTTRTD